MENFSNIISIQEFFEKKLLTIYYQKCGQLCEWKLPETRKYEIPGYQREIRWEKNNVYILLNDLQKNPGGKFLGNILISTYENSLYEIIDGQQRITVLLLILYCIKKHTGIDFTFCKFNNLTFPKFEEAIQSNFSDASVYKDNDILLQGPTLKILWDYIEEYFQNLQQDDLLNLKRSIYNSEINLLVVTMSHRRDYERSLCVDYFIDMNNKGRHLDSSDILKAYAFREEFEKITEEWQSLQQNIRELDKINYPKEEMTLHYLICTINDVLNLGKNKRINNLSDDYKLTKDLVIENTTYLKGTNVEELLANKSFYLKMFETLKEFVKFEKIVVDGNKSEFKKYFEVETGTENLDDDTIENFRYIISSILWNSDIVPKLLLLKYFIEYLPLEKKQLKEKYKLLYYINSLAVIFSSGTKKTRGAFTSLVMSSEWEEKIKQKANENMINIASKISFSKEVRNNGQPTLYSGKNLAHRLLALNTLFLKNQNDEFKLIQKDYLNFNFTKELNDEHFLINESFSVSFFYNKKEVKVPLSQTKYLSKLTYLGNYLVINNDVNNKLGNNCIKKKIQLIQEFQKKNVKVFYDDLSEQIFHIAEKCFGNNSKCPTEEELNQQDSEESAAALMTHYYEEDFFQEYSEFLRQIPNEIRFWRKTKL